MDEDRMSVVNDAMTVSSISRSLNSTVSKEVIRDKMKQIIQTMNLIQSRTYFIRGKLQRGREPRRLNITSVIDITILNKECKTKIQDLWIAIENLQLKRMAEKCMGLSIIGHGLLPKLACGQADSLISLSGGDSQLDNLYSDTKQLQGLYVQQQLCQGKEQEEDRQLALQCRTVQVWADVADNINTSSQKQATLEGYLKKIRQTSLKNNTARALITSFITFGNVNLEQNPDLQDILEKWT